MVDPALHRLRRKLRLRRRPRRDPGRLDAVRHAGRRPFASWRRLQLRDISQALRARRSGARRDRQDRPRGGPGRRADDAPEAPGLDVLLRSLSLVAGDDELLALSARLFDGLYEYRRRAALAAR